MNSGDKFVMRVFETVNLLLLEKRNAQSVVEKQEIQQHIISLLKALKIVWDTVVCDRETNDYNIF